MLGPYYRLIVRVTCNKTITYNSGGRIEANWIPWKIEQGAIVHGSELSDTTAFLNTDETAVAGDVLPGTVIDNSQDMYIGFTGTFYGHFDSLLYSTYGLQLHIEQSTDNVRWPSDRDDFDFMLHTKRLVHMFTSEISNDNCALNFFFG